MVDMQMRSFAGVWLGILGLSLVLTAGCGGPRTHYLSEHKYKALDAQSEIDVYVGTIEPPYEELAIVDSEAFAYVDDQVKQQQLDQIKRKARRLGGNAVHDVRILTKKVQGYTLDERTPFTSWRQGRYALYFMRGTVLRVPTGALTEAGVTRPKDGWVVERLAVPARIEPAGQALPMPGLATEPACEQPCEQQP